MFVEITSFHLTRGHQTLTIAKLAGRCVGLIDGRPYIASVSPDIVVRHLLQTSGSFRSGVRM